MYKIYARLYSAQNNGDWVCIHAPTLANQHLIVVEPVITLELNKAGSLKFIMQDDHPYYSIVKPLATEIKVYDNDKRIFFGRVLDTKRDFYRRKEVHCESELAFLNDVVIRPYDVQQFSVAQYFAYLLRRYNENASAARQLQTGYCNVVDSNDSIVRSTYAYPTVWEEMKKKLLENEHLGGYLIPRCEIENGEEVTYIDYLAGEVGTGSQVIRFGQNLIDLDDFLDGADTYSQIVPLGYVTDNNTQARLTIRTVNNNKDYLQDDTALGLYGVIQRSVVWDDVTEAQNLKSKGTALLASGKQFARTINISAIDLHLLNVNTDALQLGYEYEVVSAPHGYISGNTFILSKMKLDLNNPDKSSYTFGKTIATLTGG